MEYVTDLHLHSKYSRAVSQDMILPTISAWGRKKGIDILSIPDWTHPLWFREVKTQLEEASDGLYRLKSEIRNPKSETNSNNQNTNVQKEPLFLLSTEIASIYSEKGKLRRIHNLIFAPNLETADKISKEMQRRGCNLMSDGRPIIGLSSKQLLELVASIDKNAMLIPCHVWTPHFGIYGSASGYDSLNEAFDDLDKNIYGIETGLSSDPEMNWQVGELKTRSILSFSDAHSPAKMGRETTVFVHKNGISNVKSQMSNVQITYDDIAAAIKRDPQGNLRVGYTLEFYPEEGKYHYSGHRNCGVVFGPEDIRTNGNSCPSCNRLLTEGVLFRVSQLSDKRLIGNVAQKTSPSGILWFTDKTKNHPPYVKLVPLNEIIAESLDSTVASMKVKILFDNLCNTFGSEIKVLLRTPIEEIEKTAGPKIAEGVGKVRRGRISIDPGYDGEYGKVKIWKEGQDVAKDVDEEDKEGEKEQLGLF